MTPHSPRIGSGKTFLRLVCFLAVFLLATPVGNLTAWGDDMSLPIDVGEAFEAPTDELMKGEEFQFSTPLHLPLFDEDIEERRDFAIPTKRHTAVVDTSPPQPDIEDIDELAESRPGDSPFQTVWDRPHTSPLFRMLPSLRTGAEARNIQPTTAPALSFPHSRQSSSHRRPEFQILSDHGAEPLSVQPVGTWNLGQLANLSGRFRGEYVDNFNDFERASGQLLIDSGLPIGIDAEFNYWQGEMPRPTDKVYSGDVNLVYRLGQIKYVAFRMGGGANWISDGSETKFGYNTTFGLDMYVKKPFMLSTSIDWGRLDERNLVHFRGTAGLYFGRFELYAGYDYYNIVGRKYQGPMAGFGVSF